MCILIFSTADICNISYSKQNAVTYCHKPTPLYMYRTVPYRHPFQILIKLELD